LKGYKAFVEVKKAVATRELIITITGFSESGVNKVFHELKPLSIDDFYGERKELTPKKQKLFSANS
jgi:hypothetical protein